MSRTDTRARERGRIPGGTSRRKTGKRWIFIPLHDFRRIVRSRYQGGGLFQIIRRKGVEQIPGQAFRGVPGSLESVQRPVSVLKVESVLAIAGRTRAGSKRGYFMSVSQILAYMIYHASVFKGL